MTHARMHNHGTPVREKGCSYSLREAVKTGDICCIDKAMSETGVAAGNSQSCERFSVVHWACYFGKLEVSH